MKIDLAALPYESLRPGLELYRIHRRDHSPWHFAASGKNRFDPTAADERGAAYWAEDPLGAWVEVFRTRMFLTEDDLAERQLSMVTVREEIDVCDLTLRRALKGGVTTALTAGDDYSAAQGLASELAERCRGVRWRLRHDLEAELIGVALFGLLGTTAPPEVSDATTEDIPRELIARAEDAFNYWVVPPPLGSSGS